MIIYVVQYLDAGDDYYRKIWGIYRTKEEAEEALIEIIDRDKDNLIEQIGSWCI